MIQVVGLSKRYGQTLAVDQINFTVQPGKVTGFLGPNGAGKSTTMRMILGLDRPSAGQALVNGAPYRAASAPMSLMGSLLEAKAVDKGRSAFNHLNSVAATMGIGKARVHEVLDLVGLTDVAKKNASKFSLGMSQRLGIATALLADPQVLMLDEPVNGLDPDGIMWIRNLLRELAAEGRTIFLSSHLMSEMELTADHLIIIGKGRILADTSMSAFIASSSKNLVRVTSPQAPRLAEILSTNGAEVLSSSSSELELQNVTSAMVGDLALANQIALHQLTDVAPSLEEAFMEVSESAVAFHGHSESEHKA
jgi:ABC-2 type transport system ATP-binding protein